MIEEHAERTHRHEPTGFAPWGVHDFVATMARLVALTCSLANIGTYGRILVSTHLWHSIESQPQSAHEHHWDATRVHARRSLRSPTHAAQRASVSLPVTDRRITSPMNTSTPFTTTTDTSIATPTPTTGTTVAWLSELYLGIAILISGHLGVSSHYGTSVHTVHVSALVLASGIPKPRPLHAHLRLTVTRSLRCRSPLRPL